MLIKKEGEGQKVDWKGEERMKQLLTATNFMEKKKRLRIGKRRQLKRVLFQGSK